MSRANLSLYAWIGIGIFNMGLFSLIAAAVKLDGLLLLLGAFLMFVAHGIRTECERRLEVQSPQLRHPDKSRAT